VALVTAVLSAAICTSVFSSCIIGPVAGSSGSSGSNGGNGSNGSNESSDRQFTAGRGYSQVQMLGVSVFLLVEAGVLLYLYLTVTIHMRDFYVVFWV
jgi:hypothetical protein